MYEGEYGDEMEYEEEIGDDEENISDEDEEVEGMGPIEGLSGDHGLDVEVIMEDDEGEGDEDDSSEDDEEEEDSDDDDDDDDARVEIIDELGDIQELADDDDMGEWESEHDHDEDHEEEDFEGHAADEEEAHIHHSLHDQEGALGQLLRSLGGNGDDAVEIMERMGAGDLDGDDDEDPNGAEYMEEIDEEGMSKQFILSSVCISLTRSQKMKRMMMIWKMRR
jgi:E3 ubiquitin-protein ligase HUWE1